MRAQRQSIRQQVKQLLSTQRSTVTDVFSRGGKDLERLHHLLLFHELTVAQWLEGESFSKHPVPKEVVAENQSTYYLPGLEAQRVHNPKNFPWVDALERSSDEIEIELQKIIRQRDTLFATGILQKHPEKLVQHGQWDVFYLYRNANAVNNNLAMCPHTTKALNQLPLFSTLPCGMAYFSFIAPGTHIRQHQGPTNLRLRCHLGLHIPSGASLSMSGQAYHWQPNRCLILDDAYPHEVFHEGESERIVLSFDIWHPDLSDAEVSALNDIFGILAL